MPTYWAEELGLSTRFRKAFPDRRGWHLLSSVKGQTPEHWVSAANVQLDMRPRALLLWYSTGSHSILRLSNTPQRRNDRYLHSSDRGRAAAA